MKRVTGIDPSGSTFDRTDACPASAALPHVFDANPSAPRDRGTSLHGFLDRVSKLRLTGIEIEPARAQALEEADEQWRDTCASLDLAQLQLELSTEVALAYNWKADSARVLKPVAPRQYEIDHDTEVAFTLDAVGVGDRVVYVGDYKGPYAWLPDPATSLQLGVGALALARIYRARRAHVEYIRIRSDGTMQPWRGELDVFALDAVAERVHRMMSDVERMRTELARDPCTPNVTEGPYCSYCPAKVHCPAKTQLVRSVLAGDNRLSLREPITPENVGSVYALLKKAREATAFVEKAIRAYENDGEPSTAENISSSAIPVGTDPDGSRRFFGRFERDGNEVLDGDVVYAVLAEKYGAEAAAKACAMESTKEAIRGVVREHKAAGETIKAGEELVLAEIRARGGAKKPPTDKPTEFTIAPTGEVRARKRKRKAS